MDRRDPVLPRAIWPLLVLLAGALVWFLASGRDGARPGARDAGERVGGTLTGLEAGRVVLLRAELPDATVELRRSRDGWTFAGGFDDHADSSAVNTLVAELCAAPALPLLPTGGAGVDSAGLGLSGPAAVRVLLRDRDGRAAGFVLGLPNPVRELCYVRVAGREGIWGATPRLRARLLALPDAVRLLRLWPGFDAAAVDTIVRRLAGAPCPDLFARDADGAWWAREPADGARRAGATFPAYARLYGDRVSRRAGATWWRARDRVVHEWIFQLDNASLTSFGPRDVPRDTLRSFGLVPPLAAVRMTLVGGATRALEFGGDAGTGHVSALRDGRPHVLRVGAAVRGIAERPLADFLATDLLATPVQSADSLCLERPGRQTLRARRAGRAWSVAGRPGDGSRPTPGDLMGDLVLTLERLAIVEALPPAASREAALRAEGRFVLTIWGPGRPPAGETVELGLPAGTAPGPAGPATALAWFPADGKRLAVDPEIIVTLRTLLLALDDDAP